jgi:hypothetical protein
MKYTVYQLTSPSSKSYVGYTKLSASTRFDQHVRSWKKWVKEGSHRQCASKLFCAFNKYPPHEWTIEILHAVDSDSLVQELEREEIERRNTISEGYNMIPGGRGGLGKVMTTEQKQKISNSRKQYFSSDDGDKWKKELSQKFTEDNPCKKGNVPWNKGKAAPKISESLKKYHDEKIWSEEERERSRKNAHSLWERGVFDNRPLPTEETKRKISEAGKGRKQTDYQKQRAREANSGKVLSDETRKKLSERTLQIYVCPKCGVTGKSGVMKRWHFDNCRSV